MNIEIVDAPRPKSKSEAFRDTIKQIAGKNKAALLQSESDLKLFRIVASKMNLKIKSSKLHSGGWKIWVLTE